MSSAMHDGHMRRKLCVVAVFFVIGYYCFPVIESGRQALTAFAISGLLVAGITIAGPGLFRRFGALFFFVVAAGLDVFAWEAGITSRSIVEPSVTFALPLLTVSAAAFMPWKQLIDRSS